MKVLVSACLLGENCKYNGKNNYDQNVVDFLQGHEIIPVCPEVLGGLPVPRCPAEIVAGTVMTKDGRNVHREFCEGASIALRCALEEQADLAVLQPRSPSCGVRQVYDGSFSGRLVAGQGIFAGMLAKTGIQMLEAEDIKKPCLFFRA